MATASCLQFVHLVLSLLTVVALVIGSAAADLREQEPEEPREYDIIQTKNRHCRNVYGGKCYKRPGNIPPGWVCKSPGQPWCRNEKRSCCYPDFPIIPISSKGCLFGGTVWSSGSILTEACFQLECVDGTWNYTGDFDHECGNCTFGGEPLIYTFDTLNNSKPIITESNLTGEYIMTQPGLANPAEFGVHAHFTDKPFECNILTDCINGVTYHECGLIITITYDAGIKSINVIVDGILFTMGPSVQYVFGPCGALLVFKHKHINGYGENCISVIGTKGLTVALCENDQSIYGDPWAYIYAMPRLEGIPFIPTPVSQLYGLCNTWNGENQDCFTLHNGTCTDDWHCGEGYDENDEKDVPTLCNDVADTWKTNTPSVETTISTTTVV